MGERTETELRYQYAVPSQVRRADNGSELLLGTSGGSNTETTEVPAVHPYFFKGLLTRPGPAAAGMLACAAIARARYYPAPGSAMAAVIRDPVVTSNVDRLPFESFSGCGGVHARLDLLLDALGEAPRASGTADVDFGQPMRAALAGTAAGGPVLLSVGIDEVVVTTTTVPLTERKVPLPTRWQLGWSPRIDITRMSAESGLPPERTVLALTRLADARALTASGAVTPHAGGASVRGGDAEHRVTFASPHDVCTCPWWGRHRGTRGPCKHVLAARMAARTDEH